MASAPSTVNHRRRLSRASSRRQSVVPAGNDEAFALLEAQALIAEGHGHVALVSDQPQRMIKRRDLVLILRQDSAARLPDPHTAFFYQPRRDVNALNKYAGVAVFGIDRDKSKFVHLAVSSLYSSGQLSDRM